MMDGRVKTLHPKVHGGLLAIRENPEHEAAMLAHGIDPIDLLVVNLYPFEATVAKGAGWDETIENIDIGGPAMIRAAAKNHEDVAVVVDVADYADDPRRAWRPTMGRPTLACGKNSRKRPMPAPPLMMPPSPTGWPRPSARKRPEYRAVGGKLSEPMRYGENPHQNAGFYNTGENRPGVATARQVQGKQLSYNNVNDTDAAFELASEFDAARTAAVAIIKHANPCGVAEGASLNDAYLRRSPAIRFPPSAASSRSTGSSTRAPPPKS